MGTKNITLKVNSELRIAHSKITKESFKQKWHQSKILNL